MVFMWPLGLQALRGISMQQATSVPASAANPAPSVSRRESTTAAFSMDSMFQIICYIDTLRS